MPRVKSVVRGEVRNVITQGALCRSHFLAHAAGISCSSGRYTARGAPARFFYFGMYSTTGVAATFTLANTYNVSSIDVFLRTPAATTFTTFDFSLQNALSSPGTIFASAAITVPLGASTQSLNVNQTLLAGSYYLVGVVPGYAGTPVSPGDVDGWFLSTGVYNTSAGTITSLYSPNPSPAFRVNGSAAAVPEPSTITVVLGGLVLLGFASFPRRAGRGSRGTARGQWAGVRHNPRDR